MCLAIKIAKIVLQDVRQPYLSTDLALAQGRGWLLGCGHAQGVADGGV